MPLCKGRQILDSVLIANEVLDSRLKVGLPGVLCKLDIEKAYDHVSWDFLIYLLRRCGFSGKWCNWIWFCISTVRFSILVNGSPQSFFASSTGLRQGDPLSPLLFVIVMETLSHLMDRATIGGYISGFAVGSGVDPLVASHLLFVDDTLIFCNADQVQIAHLRAVFSWFEAVSGLKVNLAKSEMVPVGVVPNLESLVELMGCNIRSLPMTYLGLPLGANFNSKTIWNTVIERMEKKLGGWKRLYLSKGGKLTLLRSTLSSIPTYFLSLFHLPAGVASRLEKIQRDFLWGGLGEAHKMHLVNWTQICKPIQAGGLGVKNLRRFNKALRGKWLWRYGMERDAYWRKVVEIKYGSMWGGWCSEEGHGSYGVSVWKSIRKDWGCFVPFISYRVGAGDKVQFWHAIWCSDLPLKVLFPELFSIAREKDASVAALMSFSNGTLHWDVNFSRNLQDWELESLAAFMELIYSQTLDGTGQDQLCWNKMEKKAFSVKSFYHCLNPPSLGFPWRGIWKSKVPLRVAFFTWTAVLGKLPTIDNLRKRNMVIVNRCCLCKNAAESIDHLFLHCNLAKDLWDSVLLSFGVSWVMPCRVRVLVDCWQGGLGRQRNSLIWKAIPHCIMWCLWRERNLRSFEDLEMSHPALKMLFFRTLIEWLNATGCYSFSSLQDLLNSCNSLDH
jgi:hypothetical protein